MKTQEAASKRLGRVAALAGVLLLAAGLRFYRLAGQSLWSDEGNSVALAGRGFAEIAQRTAFDIHPPLYYWLLKLWMALFGQSEIALRALSALLGVGLVYLVWEVGRRLFGQRVGLIAALLAAISPLLVYYAQEARMYTLLAFLSTLTVLLALRILTQSRLTAGLSIAYVLAVTAGLYTHYAYPAILLTVNLAAILYFLKNPQFAIRNSELTGDRSQVASYRLQVAGYRLQVRLWLALQLIPLLLYLPWLPAAWRQLTTWPTEPVPHSLAEIGQTIATTLLLGLSWPYGWGWPALFLLIVVLVAGPLLLLATQGTKGGQSLKARADSTPSQPPPARGRSKNLSPRGGNVMKSSPPAPPKGEEKDALSLWERAGVRAIAASPKPTALVVLYLWLLPPLLLTVMIFSPAFLKFLVVAVPPLALLLAVVIDQIVGRFKPAWLGLVLGGGLLLGLMLVSLLSLREYYTNPAFARDNYRGIAQFIQAVADRDDAVVLNAEGQQDVFNYYYPNEQPDAAPVYPLPRRRPLEAAATVAELEEIAARAGTVYAVYWATQQADPDGLIEGWLDSHLYKASDQWYGNVRLVSYASPQAQSETEFRPLDVRFGGDQIELTGYRLAAETVVPGDILQVELRWQAAAPIAEEYVVFLQLLDGANRLVGQRDARLATPTWQAGELVLDQHGLFIEPGTPPGPHRLIVGLYSAATGQRLPVTFDGEQGDQSSPAQNFVELAEIEVVKPAVPLPKAAFRIRTPLAVELSPGLRLLGYDLYKLGHRSSPETPLRSGDPLRLVAYWQRSQVAPPPGETVAITVVAADGTETPQRIESPLAGVSYPPAWWSPGEIVRAQYDLFLSGLEPGSYRLRLDVAQSGEVTTRLFRVE